jgi:hypothetical protein
MHSGKGGLNIRVRFRVRYIDPFRRLYLAYIYLRKNIQIFAMFAFKAKLVITGENTKIYIFSAGFSVTPLFKI